MSRKAIIGTVVVLLVLVLGGIIVWTALRPTETKVIKIGVILSLTGPGAPYGKQVMEGILLAEKASIDQGLVKKGELKLLIEDDGTEPSGGVNAIRKLIDADGVRIVIGALASSVTLSVAPVAEKNKVLLLSPGSSNDEISKAGDYIFRIAPTDSYDGEFLASTMYKRYAVRSAAVLHLNNDFGRGLATRFSQVFESLGGKVVAIEAFAQGATDFRSHLTRIGASSPQALLLIASGNENITCLKQRKELGFVAKVFAPSTFNDPEMVKLAGDAAEGVIFSAAAFEAIQHQENVRKFLEVFKKEYGRDPTTFSAYGYDALLILLNQIKSQGYDATNVKESLYKMPPFYGASGRTSFDKNGDAEKELSLFQVAKTKIQPLSDN